MLPLCVDLDGTLVRGDLSVESLLSLLKKSPGSVFLVPWWLLKGKAYLKQRVALSTDLDAASLPYHEELLQYLREESRNGRPLYLATAADKRIARSVAQHLRLFEGVFASDGRRNLAGKNKADALRSQFGENNFAYAGNAMIDRDVWCAAQEAILIDPSPRLERQVREQTKVVKIFKGRKNAFRLCLQAMRTHHWAKNLLVFVPWVAAHKFSDARAFAEALGVFLSFCLCASGTYLVNDLLDLASDRKHPEKKDRPFASGAFPLIWGAVFGPLLLAGGWLVSLFAPHPFWSTIGLYVALATIYSWILKEWLMMDVVVLGILYTLRIFAGAMAIQVSLSPWLMAFSMFWFLSLAFMKRFIELSAAIQGDSQAGARGYVREDLPLLASLGVSSGYVAVLVFALYADSETVSALYTHPRRLWLVCLILLYWISRVWLLARRGRVQGDPVRFAIQDIQSYGAGLLAAVLFWISGTR